MLENVISRALMLEQIKTYLHLTKVHNLTNITILTFHIKKMKQAVNPETYKYTEY